MGLLSPLRKRRTTRNIVLRGADDLPPEVRAELQAKANQLRMTGRPVGVLSQAVGEEVRGAGRPWPRVLQDELTETSTVPATFEGLLALVSSWDSLLLDEELQILRDLTEVMLPAGLMTQDKMRQQRAAEKAGEEHLREHHPDEWDKYQGWRV